MKNIYEFWKDWKNVSELERNAISSIRIGKKILLENLPSRSIEAIYIKGSFVRREMNDKSDVDFLTIVKSSSLVDKIKRMDNKYKKSREPNLNFSGYSLWELKKGRLVKARSGNGFGRTGPKRMLSHLENYRLIYGQALEIDNYPQNTPEKRAMVMKKVFTDAFIPSFKSGNMTFTDIVKQVFWITYDEQRALGNSVASSWKEMVGNLSEDHVACDALRYRLKPTKDKMERAEFVKKLERHLKSMRF